MEYVDHRLIAHPRLSGVLVGEWYLKGFADAYDAHWAVVPNGPFGEHYRKGYALGLAAVRREFLATALNGFSRVPDSAQSTLL